jgi:hypothetical protein
MGKIVKGVNLKNSADEVLKLTLQEDVIDLPKEKSYYVTTDEEGNVKGYYQLKEKSLGKDWFAMYQNPILWLGQQRMTGEQYSVLLVLLNKLDYDNYLRISLQEIADLLRMQVTHVSRAMKVLKEKNIIVEGPPAGKFKTYRVNPYIAHKGKNRTATILEFGDALEKSGKRITDADINKK